MNTNKIHNLRVEYGNQLVKLGYKYKNIIALEGDLKDSTQSVQFQHVFPERFFEIGIAEQNLIGVAAGLARCGKIPVIHSFASFISMKSCEQIRTNVAFQKLNVKMVVSHAGVSAGSAGTTHHAIEDIAILRSMPNMKILVPGDAYDVKHCVEEMFRTNGPVYLRISAYDVESSLSKLVPRSEDNSYFVKQGYGITIFTTGITLKLGENVTLLLKSKYGIDARHIHISRIKPIDQKVIESIINDTEIIYTIEEHNIIGGFGSSIAEVASSVGGCKVVRLGITDHYCMPASKDYIFDKENLTPLEISERINKELKVWKS